MVYYSRKQRGVSAWDCQFSQICPYLPQYLIKAYGCNSSWQIMKFLKIQHFCRSGGPSRAKIFGFEKFQPQSKSAGLHMFSVGKHQISAGRTAETICNPAAFCRGTAHLPCFLDCSNNSKTLQFCRTIRVRFVTRQHTYIYIYVHWPSLDMTVKDYAISWKLNFLNYRYEITFFR